MVWILSLGKEIRPAEDRTGGGDRSAHTGTFAGGLWLKQPPRLGACVDSCGLPSILQEGRAQRHPGGRWLQVRRQGEMDKRQD